MSGETPETTQPAFSVPMRAITYSGVFGRLMPTMSPFRKPLSSSMFAN